MFRRILVPVPMENVPELALKRAGEMAKRFGSRIFVHYIIQSEVFDLVQEQSTHVITEGSQEDLFKEMSDIHRTRAEKSILPDVKSILGRKPDGFSVKEGEFHDQVLESIEELKAELVRREYHHFSLRKYKIMDRSPVPIWIERNSGNIKKIGLFCSNLAPNEISPKAAKKLAREFDAKLYPYFIQDPASYIDEEEPAELADEKGLKWREVVNKRLDDFIYRKARKRDFDLIIIGRMKKRGYFHLRSKFAKRTHCSVLMVK